MKKSLSRPQKTFLNCFIMTPPLRPAATSPRKGGRAFLSLENYKMSDYKNTLNLPNTSFSIKANLAQQEPKILAQWQEINLYQKIRALRAGQKKFILYDGPPYANGDIHIGHAVNKILKDIVIKSKNLNGLDVPFIPGWDGHG